MKKFLSLIVALVFATTILFLYACKNDKGGIKLLTEYSGKTIDLCEEGLKEYLSLTDSNAQAEFLYEHQSYNYDSQNVADFSWTGDKSGDYTVFFSDNGDFSNAVQFKTGAESIELGFFMPDKTYYWKVVSSSGKESKVDSFKTADCVVRYITISARNFRDMGGWSAQGGKKVNYGLIYRGARLNSSGNKTRLSDEEYTVLNDVLKIKTEIDLRTPGKDDYDQTVNVINNSGLYVKTPFDAYTCIFSQFLQEKPVARVHDERAPKSIKQIFTVLADENSYPIYFHCNAGADRTGTLAFLINGLLGVEYEDLTKDFEITSFSKFGKRWRSDIVNGQFCDDGVMQDNLGNYVAWGVMYDFMMKYYGNGTTLSAAIENYLVEFCGVYKADIENIKRIMLS